MQTSHGGVQLIQVTALDLQCQLEGVQGLHRPRLAFEFWIPGACECHLGALQQKVRQGRGHHHLPALGGYICDGSVAKKSSQTQETETSRRKSRCRKKKHLNAINFTALLRGIRHCPQKVPFTTVAAAAGCTWNGAHRTLDAGRSTFFWIKTSGARLACTTACLWCIESCLALHTWTVNTWRKESTPARTARLAVQPFSSCWTKITCRSSINHWHCASQATQAPPAPTQGICTTKALLAPTAAWRSKGSTWTQFTSWVFGKASGVTLSAFAAGSTWNSAHRALNAGRSTFFWIKTSRTRLACTTPCLWCIESSWTLHTWTVNTWRKESTPARTARLAVQPFSSCWTKITCRSSINHWHCASQATQAPPAPTQGICTTKALLAPTAAWRSKGSTWTQFTSWVFGKASGVTLSAFAAGSTWNSAHRALNAGRSTFFWIKTSRTRLACTTPCLWCIESSWTLHTWTVDTWRKESTPARTARLAVQPFSSCWTKITCRSSINHWHCASQATQAPPAPTQGICTTKALLAPTAAWRSKGSTRALRTSWGTCCWCNEPCWAFGAWRISPWRNKSSWAVTARLVVDFIFACWTCVTLWSSWSLWNFSRLTFQAAAACCERIFSRATLCAGAPSEGKRALVTRTACPILFFGSSGADATCTGASTIHVTAVEMGLAGCEGMKTVKKVWSSKTDIKTKLQNPHASKPDAAGLMLSLVPQLPGEGLQIFSELLHLRAPDLRWALPDPNRGPQPRAPDLSGHCPTSTSASSRSQWVLPDLNPELRSQCASRGPQLRTQWAARPQPRAQDFSGTASSRSQWAMAELNHERQIWHSRLIWQCPCQRECQTECQIECQIECQKERQNECQNGCQKKCQNECQIEWQNRWQIEYQKECQIECQRKCQNRCQKDPERMQDRMSE